MTRRAEPPQPRSGEEAPSAQRQQHRRYADRARWPLRGHAPRRSIGLALLALLAGCASGTPVGDADREWRAYGGDPGSHRYSPLTQINRSNVHQLRVAWEYRTGDLVSGVNTQIQVNPLIVRGVLYGVSPAMNAFALDAATGREIWRFDPVAARPALQAIRRNQSAYVSRGVVYWEDGADRRIFFTAGPRLFALDAATGRPLPGFGTDGSVDLREGLGRDTAGLFVAGTTPGVAYRDLLIQGMRLSEAEGAAPGHVRAFDARTGRVRWTFRTIPQPGEPGHETWPADAWRTAGGANSWAGMSVDTERGIVYVPTGSATPDFYGGSRPGQNLFANTLLALNAATGERIWHFQTVHHDIWDRDLPAPPNLVTVRRGGRRVDAVAQITKSAHIFLFDRETGEPLFPIEERPFPRSDLHGEESWPTQPIPVKPAPFARQLLTEDSLTDISPEARAHVLERFRKLKSAGQFIPPSLEGTIVFPGFDGGGEWGGAAVDPGTGILYVNSSEMPWIAAMVERATPSAATPRSGAEVYAASCAGCHGVERRGDGGRTPSLVGLHQRRSATEVRNIVTHGAGFMPAFKELPPLELEAVVAYLMSGAPAAAAAPAAARPQAGGHAGYRFGGYLRFVDPNGYPAVKPPWGTLNAIDLNSGELVWKVPLGELPELTARGIPPTGTENYGGPVVTAGGLVFIGASKDEKFRAFDKRTGRMLWETRLPAGGYATPSVYEVNGKQYVVIAAGGGKMGTRSGDAYVAFALPN